jgi:hypothetical protein
MLALAATWVEAASSAELPCFLEWTEVPEQEVVNLEMQLDSFAEETGACDLLDCVEGLCSETQ